MHASSVNLLLADTGSRGIALLRALSSVTHSSDLISRFVGARDDIARRWIRARPRDTASVNRLSQADLDSIYGQGVVSTLAESLDLEVGEVVRLLNETLFAGTRLAAPDGERVSERAARRLDEDIRDVIAHAS
jgi:hypothetical protein